MHCTVIAQFETNLANHTSNNIYPLQPVIHAKCPSTIADALFTSPELIEQVPADDTTSHFCCAAFVELASILIEAWFILQQLAIMA